MKYIDAIKLHIADEVICKRNNDVVYVEKIYDDIMRKQVHILCDDGNWYHHNEIRKA